MHTFPGFAVLLGRGAAICLHPHAAWRVRPAVRIGIVSAYAAAGYAVALGVLLLL